MFGTCQYLMLIEARTKSILRRLLLILTSSNKVTVLLLMTTLSGVACAQDAKGVDPSLFEFTSEFHTNIGSCRLDGLMACDGSQYRIVVYWVEPAVFHDSRFFLSYSDFIFSKDVVHYWIYGESKPGTFHLSENRVDSLLPEKDSVESAVRSALAILNRIRSEPTTDVPLNVGRFFQGSRDQMEHTYEVLTDEAKSDNLWGDTASDVEILNALPYGRKYSKHTRSDGVLEWGAQRP